MSRMQYICRKKEEEFLANCDNSCANPDCVCKLEIGTSLRGKAIGKSNHCVLCLRKFGKVDYTNLVQEYPKEAFHSEYPFIKYDKSDYSKLSSTTIVQIFKPGNYEIHQVLDLEDVKIPFDNDWNLIYCNKDGILSFTESQYSIGSGEVIYNFKNRTLNCKKCKEPVRRLHPDINNIIDFRGTQYTSCMICESITNFNVWDTPQLCRPCKNQIREIIEESKRICDVCNKKGIITVAENGMLLCKVHRRSLTRSKKN